MAFVLFFSSGKVKVLVLLYTAFIKGKAMGKLTGCVVDLSASFDQLEESFF